jgi:putative peptide-modifying radical SAM enzyme
LFFHLILTDDCNLCCTYCRGKIFSPGVEWRGTCGEVDLDLPPDLSLDLEDLARFLAGDPVPTLTFYGGEPLLRPDLIMSVMDRVPWARYMIQTNGLLLSRIPGPYLRRFDTILVSLDGPPALTDRHRGRGTHARVLENLQTIRERHQYSGELIARMTICEDTEIYEAVMYLATNPGFPFASIHWQLDADFSGDVTARDFRSWIEGRYNPGIRRLVAEWVKAMAGEGMVRRWYPFIDPMEDLLAGRESSLRCGSGYANYTIMTDGSIGPCPVMVGMKDYYVGHISTAHPLRLKTVHIPGECNGCEIRGFCGGRCLYSHIVRPWPPEWRALVCGSVRNLDEALAAALPEVRRLIAEGCIRDADFAHTRYNGCEIIP